MPEMLFIVGAGRSGTNLLSRMLEHAGGFSDLSENRYIWNYKQRYRSTDRRLPEEANEAVSTYIRRHYAVMSETHSGVLIDKTPGNALRLDFVSQIFPEAKIVNIVRDGRANVLSRSALWDEEGLLSDGTRPGMLTRYMRRIRRMRALGNLPNDRIPAFLADNMPALASRILLRRATLSGERVAGLREIEQRHGTRIARAVQWREVATFAAIEGRALGPDRYHEVGFENMLRNPRQTAEALFTFLGHDGGARSADWLDAKLDPGRLDNWKQRDRAEIAEIEPYLTPALTYFDYEVASDSVAAHKEGSR
ncbi:sulfotransferase family protein [Pelagimonas varians]|nr:sulfotransferase [Pelagimonas varians]